MPRFSIEPNENITYKVHYEDDDLLVVNKPARIVTTPGLGHDRSSLLNALFSSYGPRLQNMGQDRGFGLLHRLDRGTSGLVIVALRVRAYDALREAFERRRVRKFYWAVTRDRPLQEAGVVNRPILEHQSRPGGAPRGPAMKLARVSPAGKEAVTAFRLLQATPAGVMLECRALTGRLHQVRVHLASIGCPIYGDDLYAPTALASAAPRLALHAHRLVFDHPTTAARLDLRSPWPDDLRGFLKGLALRKPSAGAAAAHAADPPPNLPPNSNPSEDPYTSA